MLIFELKWAKTCVLPLAVACTLHVCAVSSRVQVQQLPQRSCWKFQLQTASFCLPQNCSKIHCSLRAGFVRLAYESNYGSAANSMPSNMKNELLAILEVDFGQFCAGPSRERRYKVRSAIFRFSDRFYMPLYHSLVALNLLPHRWHPFYCTLGI